MSTAQPEWKFVANLGDANPIDYGGAFLYEDQTKVYDPEVEYLIAPEGHEKQRWIVYRFSVDPCTYIDGILSDNKFHPNLPAWFAKPESQKEERPQDTTYLSDIASSVGMPIEDLIKMFTSDDIRVRAQAWIMVGEYHGFENLDHYPLIFNREEVEQRYAEEIK